MPEPAQGSLIREAKSLLRQLKIAPRKKMGQNFMIREDELSFISDSLALAGDETVVEIGAGLGFLTRRLLQKTSKVIAVEKDEALSAYLGSAFKNKLPKVLQMDILKLDLCRHLNVSRPIVVAGNIPYQITSPILEWLVLQRRWVDRAVLTMQWEVASRLLAPPGSRLCGPLTIFVQVYADAELLRRVGRQNFWPAPKVDSAVVRLQFLKKPKINISDEARFFSIIRRAFQKRRKTILNSLANPELAGFSKDNVALAIRKTDIDPKRRPETLSIADWANLASVCGSVCPVI